MAASRCYRRLCQILALTLVLGARAHARADSQAELTCLLDSGDLLSGHRDSRGQEPLWQTLTSVRRGDQNRARLSLASVDAGFVPGVTTQALLRLELRLGDGPSNDVAAVRDVSSSLAMSLRLGEGVNATLRAFPLDTDYLRLGYLHALDWGGTDASRGESIFLQKSGAAPGVQLALDARKVRVFSALKWASMTDALRGTRRLWGVLAGGRFELGPTFSVDLGFGYFQRPAVDFAATEATTFVEGASFRIGWHRGPLEPELSPEPFRPPSLREEPTDLTGAELPGSALALEGVTLVQRLRRFEAPNETALVAAPAAALYGSARGAVLAGHAALTWRSLAFVARNDPGIARGDTLPPTAVPRAELGAWLGGSLTWRWLCPSFELGVRLPAALETPSAVPGYGQTLRVTVPGGFEGLPFGAGRLPVLSARLGLRYRVSPRMALLLAADFEHDPNRLVASAAASGRVFGNPETLTLLAAAQARF